MSKAHPPELKKYMDKRLSLKLNGGRVVSGILRGFDPFMNVVVDESIEECKDGTRNNIGMVVSEEEGWEGKVATLKKREEALYGTVENLLRTLHPVGEVIRGNSIIMVEALDRI
ncbi:hypothetical protein pipiens_004445 [Culex pipiens pipiens]|uniref:Small nuclear ribonucleoprotein G n=1 Tax=Culex pipiens pipiens TaxID=38569 RepID=A0ABD1CJ00_CULPP